MNKNTKYSLLVLASALVLPVTCGCVAGALYLFFSMHNIVGAIFIAVLGIAIFMCKSPLDDQRIKARKSLYLYVCRYTVIASNYLGYCN